MKAILNRTVTYTEQVILEVPNANSKRDIIESVLQNKEYTVFPISLEKDKIYTYHFNEIPDEII